MDRHRLAAGLAVFAGLSATTLPPLAHAQTLRRSFPVANRAITGLALSGDTLYLAGTFTEVAPWLGNGIPLAQSDAQPWPIVPAVEGRVWAMTPDGSGGWFIGGDFQRVAAQPRHHLAHILANGAVSPWSPNPDGPVWALARFGDQVYVGGRFSTISGQARESLAALDEGSGEALPWESPVRGTVTALAATDSSLFVGGVFDSVGGAPCLHLAAVHRLTTQRRATFLQADGEVDELLVVGDEVFASGLFTTLGGLPRIRSGSFDRHSGVVSSWSPPTDMDKVRFAASPTTLYCVGNFSTVGGQPRKGLAAFDLATLSLLPWAPSPTQCIAYDIAYDAGRLFVGGLARTCNFSEFPQPVFELDPVTGAALDWNAHVVGDAVWNVEAANGSVFIAGDVSGAGGVTRRGTAAIRASTGEILDWHAPIAGYVTGLLVQGPDLLVGGAFSLLAAPSRSNLVALDRATAVVTAWDPAPNGGILDMKVLGGTLYCVGSFTSIGSALRAGLAGIDLGTGFATPWQPNVTYSHLEALAVGPDRVYIGGHLLAVDGLPRQNLAAVHPVTAAALPWAPSVGHDIWVVHAESDRVLAGASYGFVTLDAATGASAPFPPTSSSHPDVHAIARAGNRLLMGNWHRSFPTPPGGCLFGWDLSAEQALTGLPVVSGSGYLSLVNRIAGDERSAFVGGDFQLVDGAYRDDLLAVDFSPPVTSAPPAATGSTASIRPSPWRIRALLTLRMERPGMLRADLYDAAGRQVATPIEPRWSAAGTHRATLEASGLAPGLYLCRIQANGVTTTLKSVLIR